MFRRKSLTAKTDFERNPQSDATRTPKMGVLLSTLRRTTRGRPRALRPPKACRVPYYLRTALTSEVVLAGRVLEAEITWLVCQQTSMLTSASSTHTHPAKLNYEVQQVGAKSFGLADARSDGLFESFFGRKIFGQDSETGVIQSCIMHSRRVGC